MGSGQNGRRGPVVLLVVEVVDFSKENEPVVIHLRNMVEKIVMEIMLRSKIVEI